MSKASSFGSSFLQRLGAAHNSSTELRGWHHERTSAVTASLPDFSPDRREVRLVPMACARRLAECGFYVPVEGWGERIESVHAVNPQVLDSNRKDIQKRTAAPLFNDANTCRIQTFADQQRQKSVAADDGLMDRSAECAAGGIDVI